MEGMFAHSGVANESYYPADCTGALSCRGDCGYTLIGTITKTDAIDQIPFLVGAGSCLLQHGQHDTMPSKSTKTFRSVYR
jgi:hypothetical protein